MSRKIRLLLALLLPVTAALIATNLAFAHGSLLTPLTRIFSCYQQNPESPDTMPCQDLVNMSGTQPLYDWNEVNQRGGGSVANSMSLLPDGHICSAGREKYYGLDQTRADWPMTILPAGGSPYTFQLAVTANHPIATFHFFVTNGYNPNMPLKWADLTEFATVSNPTLDTVSGLQYPVYQFPLILPSRTGRELIFVLWERHDSLEDFYMCSDVWFGSASMPTPTKAPACTAPEWILGGGPSSGNYETGAIVSHNSKQWIARWTNSDEPRTDLGSASWQIQANCTSGGSGGTPLPTATFVIPPTATKTPLGAPTATACVSCGPTNTPPAATATHNVPTATPGGPTATNTKAPTSTKAPSKTRTPTKTATAGGPTATRTKTAIAPTATATSGSGGGTACSPVNATITAPFTFDGAGTLCWKSNNLGTYINTWNTGKLTVNGVDFTNKYVFANCASGSPCLPAKLSDGYWYISYTDTSGFGHFEAK